MDSCFTFPKDFTWGAATASYQIEGAADKDGRGKSIWDKFSDEPGRVLNGDSGAEACRHYYLWKEDIALMKKLNLKAYRFSIAWPRIFPEGEGKPNKKGTDFYDRLIDGLLENGIEPWITLFHWDLPLALQEKYGGWQSRETVKRFYDYSLYCAEKFSDRVKNWFTVNEIFCFTQLSYHYGQHAPGMFLSKKEVNQITHNALLAHGFAVKALKETNPEIKAGLVENLNPVWPLYESKENIKAAEHAFYDLNQQRLFPVLTGKYDEETYVKNNGDFPEIKDGDMEIIGTPTDFIGYNFYHGIPVISDDKSKWKEVKLPEGYPETDMGWPITPKGLYWTLNFSNVFFPELPIYITENGLAQKDRMDLQGKIQDTGRIEYYRTHLETCSRAVNEGIPLKGFFAWSLMDNFEWAFGYTKRFGLVYVNYRTQERTVKESGKYYSQVIKNSRVL